MDKLSAVYPHNGILLSSLGSHSHRLYPINGQQMLGGRFTGMKAGRLSMYKDLLKRAMFKTNGCVKVLSLGWQVWSEGDSACREETTCLGAKTQIFGSFIK